MKYVVTGAAGFIGSHLTATLLAAGQDVTGIDRLGEPRLSAAWNELAEHPNFTAIHADVLETDLVAALQGASAVFNLAGRGGYRQSWVCPTDFARDNVETVRVLLAARGQATGPRLVHASTSSVLGIEAVGDEGSSLAPCSPYGDSKAAAEVLVSAAADTQDAVTVRLFSVYGSRQRPEMGIYQAIDAALGRGPMRLFGDGLHERAFTHVSDVVRGMIAAAQRGRPGETYHVGAEKTHTIADVLRLTSLIAQAPVPFVGALEQRGNQRHTRCLGAKARSELRFTAKVPLADGLHEQFKWQSGRVGTRRKRPAQRVGFPGANGE